MSKLNQQQQEHQQRQRQSVFARLEFEQWLRNELHVKNPELVRHKVWKTFISSSIGNHNGSASASASNYNSNSNTCTIMNIRSVPYLPAVVYERMTVTDDDETVDATCNSDSDTNTNNTNFYDNNENENGFKECMYVLGCTSRVVDEKWSTDGGKLVIELQNGKRIETVIIHHTRKSQCDDSINNNSSNYNKNIKNNTNTRNDGIDHNNNITKEGTCHDEKKDNESNYEINQHQSHDSSSDTSIITTTAATAVSSSNSSSTVTPFTTDVIASTGTSTVVYNDDDDDDDDDDGDDTVPNTQHKNTTVDKVRTTICVSSQVGCGMGCTFCATGTMGHISNVTAAEIVEQIYHANIRTVARGYGTISNVVFMGMGEPLDNYNSVVEAIHSIPMAFPATIPSMKRITVSTVGIPRMIHKLTADCPNVQLALSLHAPNDSIRKQIVPTGKAYSLHKIMKAVDFYLNYRSNPNDDTDNCDNNNPNDTTTTTGRTATSSTNNTVARPSRTTNKRCVMIEYIMIDKINSSIECAIELRNLLQGRTSFVNLIPYNPTSAGDRYKYQCPSDDDMIQFQKTVLGTVTGSADVVVGSSSTSLSLVQSSNNNQQQHQLKCSIRWSSRRGQNIDAACGQLVLQQHDHHQKQQLPAVDGTTQLQSQGKAKAKGIGIGEVHKQQQHHDNDMEDILVQSTSTSDASATTSTRLYKKVTLRNKKKFRAAVARCRGDDVGRVVRVVNEGTSDDETVLTDNSSTSKNSTSTSSSRRRRNTSTQQSSTLSRLQSWLKMYSFTSSRFCSNGSSSKVVVVVVVVVVRLLRPQETYESLVQESH